MTRKRIGILSMLVMSMCMSNPIWARQVEVSTNELITLQAKKTTLKSAIDDVEKKTGYRFFYKSDDIDLTEERANVNFTGDIDSFLSQLFEGTDIFYTIKNKDIVLRNDKNQEDSNTMLQQAERRTIKGTVVDEQGDPIIGASVVEGNSTNGTITDIDGNFTLTLSGDKVNISYIGFSSRSLSVVDGKDLYHITLVEDTKLLEEVVVVGYGTQKKVNVIGSIAAVDSKKLESRTSSNVSNMLTGQLSGVTITQSSGSPGQDGGTIRVRGVGSFGATPSPLVLIDGLPGNLNDVNPADIESVSVLKDASSAAIYGSRAANGVILVKTKEGEKGKVSISYNGYVGFNKASELPQMVRSWEYAEMYNLAMGRKVYSEEDIEKYKNGTDPDHYANEMYLDDLLGGKGFQTGHEVTLNGGTEKTSYMLSLGYLNQDGLVKHNSYDKYTARVNLTNKLSEKITLTTRISGLKSKRGEPSTPGSMDTGGVGGLIRDALRFPGLWATKLSDGSFGSGPKLMGTAPAWLDSNSFYRESYNKFHSNLELAYRPIEGLSLKAIGGYNYDDNHVKHYKSAMTIGDRDLGPSSLNESNYRTIYKTFQGVIDYNTRINEHEISALGGYTWEEQAQRTIGASRLNYPSDDVPFLDAGGADGQLNSGGGYDWAIMSFFGRLSYNYAHRYLLETTMRYDGSSRFPEDSKFGFFPSLAGGWRMSEEAFIKENEKLSFIDNLKLKASYGILGNNNIGNYPYQSTYSLGSNMNYIFGDLYQQGAAVTTYVDPSLKWEKTTTTDIGFESSFWRGMLTFNASYFYRKTTDILYKPSSSYSSIFGLNLSQINTGSLENRGWEFELGHQNTIGDFSYNINGNFSIIKNKVLSLGIGDVEQENGMIGNGSNLFIGHPMNLFYGYKTDGVFLTDDEVDKWADQSSIAPDAQAGDIRYVDLNGDGKVTSADRTYLGSRIPKYTYGLNLGCNYKNIDFSMLIQGVSGVKGYLSNWAGWAFFQEGNIQKWQMKETWSVDQTNRYPGYPRLEVMSNAGSINTQTSDFWLLNASYLKVRNIQVGYTLPKEWIKKMGLSNLRFYFSTENPFTIKSYRKGWDPEISTGGDFYPIMSTYTFGLSLKI